MTGRGVDVGLSALAAALAVGLWAAVIPATASTGQDDAAQYLAMAREGPAAAQAPFRYRLAAPWLAHQLPMTAEHALQALTWLSLWLTGWLWCAAARRLSYSWSAVGLGAAAIFSTQGWANFFHDPWLTDAPGQLGLVATWWCWAFGPWWLALGLLAVAPLLRETAALASVLWATAPPRWRAALLVPIAAASVALPRLLWPAADDASAPFFEALAHKGPARILGDAFASLHGLWCLWPLGLRLASPARRAAWAAPLGLTLMAGAILSLVATNTVRMLSLSLPFVGLACAEALGDFAARHPRLSWALAALLTLGALVWFPLARQGALAVAYKSAQTAFGVTAALCCLAVAVVGWRRRD